MEFDLKYSSTTCQNCVLGRGGVLEGKIEKVLMIVAHGWWGQGDTLMLSLYFYKCWKFPKQGWWGYRWFIFPQENFKIFKKFVLNFICIPISHAICSSFMCYCQFFKFWEMNFDIFRKSAIFHHKGSFEVQLRSHFWKYSRAITVLSKCTMSCYWLGSCFPFLLL